MMLAKEHLGGEFRHLPVKKVIVYITGKGYLHGLMLHSVIPAEFHPAVAERAAVYDVSRSPGSHEVLHDSLHGTCSR